MVSLPLSAVSVPPVAVVDALAGVAMVTPSGRVLLKSILAASAVLPELSIVKISVLVLPTVIESGVKILLNPGGGLTRRVALAVPLLPRLEDSSPVRLVKSPKSFAVTSIEMVAVLPAVIVAPAERWMVPDPSVADTADTVPPAVVFTILAGSAITRPAGRGFENARAVASTVLLVLSMVYVSVTVSPCAIGSEANAWLKLG